MEIIDEIEFKKSNPGVLRYGNIKDYYKFYSAINRMKLMPMNVWKTDESKYIGLDIGCNTGDLTVLLMDFFKKIHGQETDFNFLGIDFDSTLIAEAKEKHALQKSVQFECIDFMNDDQTFLINEYLKNNNKSKFNVTFCLRITMWIHLNHGDEGLKNFLKKVCHFSDLVMIEPQSWKYYTRALEQVKKENSDFPLFNQIVYGQNVEEYIKNIMKECNFINIHEVGTGDDERKIWFYKRKE